MLVSRSFAASVVASAIALVFTVPVAQGRSCIRPGEHVLVANQWLAAYYRGTSSLYGIGRTYTDVVLCRLSDGLRRRVDDPEEPLDGAYNIRIAGRFAAWVFSGRDAETLNILDARRHDAPIATPLEFDGPDCGCVPGLLLRPTGSIADVARERKTAGWYPPEVETCAFCMQPGKGRPSKVRDKGRAIDPRSLRYRAGRVYWHHGKRERSAPLP
jgi:hypothetical protein